MVRFALAGILIACTLAASASAGTIVVKLTLVPGKLTLQAKPLTIAKGTSSLKVSVADARRTGAGWTLRFTRGTGMTVIGITARCAAHATCTLPTAAARPSGRIVLRAAKATGMGAMKLVVTVRAAKATTVGFAVS